MRGWGDFEMHTLHRGLERGLFADVTLESGIGFPTLPFVGFGVTFLDFDNDGDLDLLVTNNGQDAELLRNDGGNRANALLVRLRGAGNNREAIGADSAHIGIADRDP